MYSAEELADEFIDQLLLSSASFLYDKYLDNKTFKYASNTALNHLKSEVALSYVQIDSGESNPSLWLPPPLPSPCPIDSWAKCVIPVRRDSHAASVASPAAAATSVRPSQLTPPVAAGTAAVALATGAAAAAGVVERLWVQTTVDAVEQTMREAKERTYKKKTEEEQAEKKRHEENEKEHAKISKIREELKHKNFSHDADGNIIFLEPVEVTKLPSSTAVPVPKLKSDEPTPNNAFVASSLASLPSLPPAELALAAAKKPLPIPESAADPADNFKRLQATNSALAAINPRPGVTVTEKGRSTKGPDAKKLVQDPNILSKAEYLQMLYINKAKLQAETPPNRN